jgi:hypothetical protein
VSSCRRPTRATYEFYPESVDRWSRQHLLCPELVRPELVRPELVRPELVRPELVRPELFRPELPEPTSAPAPNGPGEPGCRMARHPSRLAGLRLGVLLGSKVSVGKLAEQVERVFGSIDRYEEVVMEMSRHHVATNTRVRQDR